MLSELWSTYDTNPTGKPKLLKHLWVRFIILVYLGAKIFLGAYKWARELLGLNLLGSFYKFPLLFLKFSFHVFQLATKFKRGEVLRRTEILKNSKTSQLKSSHINAAQTLLRRQFHSIGGLFSCEVGSHVGFPAPTEQQWLQFLHTDINHWVLAAFGSWIKVE